VPGLDLLDPEGRHLVENAGGEVDQGLRGLLVFADGGVQRHLAAEAGRDDNSDAPGSPFWDPGAVLTTREVESFVADGFVAIRGAVPGDVVTACQDEIWAELGKLGVTEDPASWAEPCGSPVRKAGRS
jgi:hypothetical protein